METQALREERISTELERSRLRPGASARSDRIINAIRDRCGDASVFLVLGETPEQNEDILVALVDDRTVAQVRLNRDSDNTSVTAFDPEQYKRGLKGLAAIEFDVARRYARQLLATS